MAVAYILNCHEDSGGFSYMPSMGNPTASMTGVALLCLELCGEHGNEDCAAAGEFILSRPPVMTTADGRPEYFRYYAFYYCGQAMFQLGGKYWNEFAPMMYECFCRISNRTDAGRTRISHTLITPVFRPL